MQMVDIQYMMLLMWWKQQLEAKQNKVQTKKN